ncbi:zinc-ribbon domain-containing protein [Lachnospiraceae bacterium WCA-693-APC-MOT-I]|uniref:Zinc-ribbon domain-containing protein n=2 Tax=Velocimicrobium porci TaxID=2606634 RepID=A0A6L5XZX5_9FIRM|nr:zinc-ribbon domain-containing protein [Velocimicrobium porci]
MEEKVMSIVKCPKCGREVSDSAEACTNCGYGIKEHFEEIKCKQDEERHAILEKAKEEERLKRIKEKQKESEATIAKLQANIKEGKKIAIPLLIWSVFWTIILAVSILYDFNGLIIVFSAICGIIGWFIFCLNWASTNDLVKDVELAQKNSDEYESEKIRRAETAYKAAQINEARRKEEESLKHPKCPLCGSTNTQVISTLNRAVSIGAVGLASSKIGKQYECKKCRHKW